MGCNWRKMGFKMMWEHLKKLESYFFSNTTFLHFFPHISLFWRGWVHNPANHPNYVSMVVSLNRFYKLDDILRTVCDVVYVISHKRGVSTITVT